jgi:2-dehydro-3-deoxy-D-arabinonate dehydratase
MTMLYRGRDGAPVVVENGRAARLEDDWDSLFNRPDLAAYLRRRLHGADARASAWHPDRAPLAAPIGNQEVWAAGVTYYRSRDARIEESRDAGGGDFYARVYEADRPELFFKATPHRVVGHRDRVRIRRDSRWSVPEPELALAVNSAGRILGFTICNDMSARDIEGENPLYLPQAKVYDRCCALGPGILVAARPLPRSTTLRMEIRRGGRTVFSGATTLARLKRSPESLVAWLFRENRFPAGCFLSTGTGIVPPDSFTLKRGDRIRISAGPVGTLENEVL